jgi:hypothetical protein
MSSCESPPPKPKQRSAERICSVFVYAINDVSPIVRRKIVIAVGLIGTEASVPRLTRWCQKDRSPAARIGYYYPRYNWGQDTLTELLKLLNYK